MDNELREHLEGMETRLNAGIDRLNARIDGMESGLNARIDGMESGLNARIDSVEARLNTRIDGVEARLNTRIDGVEAHLNTRIDNVHARVDNAVALIEGVKESLEREFRNVSDKVSLMSTRLDRIAAGSHFVARLVDWADRQDKIEEESLLRFQRIESRLDKLEKPGEQGV